MPVQSFSLLFIHRKYRVISYKYDKTKTERKVVLTEYGKIECYIYILRMISCYWRNGEKNSDDNGKIEKACE